MTSANPHEYPPLGADETPGTTTWARIPLEEILAGDYAPPTPTILTRTDGRCLIYPGKCHALQAEPEALKSWLALGATVEQLAGGYSVLYIDFEDTASSVVSRLRALRVNPQAIRDRFIYLRPDEPLTAAAIIDLEAATQTAPMLAVIDGVTEAFTRQGLNPLDNSDVATWLELLPRRLTRNGIAVLQLDHVVKDREQRGRWAIGGGHKLAGVDVAYSMHVIERFGRGHDGTVTIKVEKDRPGGIREYAPDSIVATLRATSHHDGHVTLTLDPPDPAAGHADEFRPTTLMERISRYVEATPGASTADIEANVRGKATFLRQAISELEKAGHLHREKDGSAWRHHIDIPFTSNPTSSPRPNSSPLVPDDPSKNSSPRPPLNKGRGRGRDAGPDDTRAQIVP